MLSHSLFFSFRMEMLIREVRARGTIKLLYKKPLRHCSPGLKRSERLTLFAALAFASPFFSLVQPSRRAPSVHSSRLKLAVRTRTGFSYDAYFHSAYAVCIAKEREKVRPSLFPRAFLIFSNLSGIV